MDLMTRRRALLAQIVERGDDTMELIGTYTITESWENDNLGNAETIWLLLKPYIEADNLGSQYNIYLVLYTNNNAQNVSYKADYGLYYGNGTLNTTEFITVRNNRTNRTSGASNNRSLWASTGTVIKFYRILQPIN